MVWVVMYTELTNTKIILKIQYDRHKSGGWGGIRTLETLARLPVFKTGAFNHSATHPLDKSIA